MWPRFYLKQAGSSELSEFFAKVKGKRPVLVEDESKSSLGSKSSWRKQVAWRDDSEQMFDPLAHRAIPLRRMESRPYRFLALPPRVRLPCTRTRCGSRPSLARDSQQVHPTQKREGLLDRTYMSFAAVVEREGAEVRRSTLRVAGSRLVQAHRRTE